MHHIPSHEDSLGYGKVVDQFLFYGGIGSIRMIYAFRITRRRYKSFTRTMTVGVSLVLKISNLAV